MRHSDRMRRLWPLLLLGSAISCSSTSGLKPITTHDSQVPCPGGSLIWNLEIQDQRAEHRGHGDAELDASAEDEPREEVSAELVGAKQVIPRRALQP